MGKARKYSTFYVCVCVCVYIAQIVMGALKEIKQRPMIGRELGLIWRR